MRTLLLAGEKLIKDMSDELVVIHQPDFIPYLGFFHRLIQADIYVVFDDVQFVNGTSRSWTHRDKIKTAKGEKWISLGTQKAPHGTLINEMLLQENDDWKKANLNLLRENYRKAPFFAEIFPYIEKLYSLNVKKMWEFNYESIKMLIELFGIDIKIVISSDLDTAGKNNDLVISTVKALGCHRYLSGVGARDYYDPEPYEKAGVEVIWQDFNHPTYKQQYEELGFIPYLSSIDLLFNCGIEESRKILRSC